VWQYPSFETITDLQGEPSFLVPLHGGLACEIAAENISNAAMIIFFISVFV